MKMINDHGWDDDIHAYGELAVECVACEAIVIRTDRRGWCDACCDDEADANEAVVNWPHGAPDS